MMRGATSRAQVTTTQARSRIRFSTGFPPLALLKCLQSGENQASPTGRPPVASLGEICRMFWQK